MLFVLIVFGSLLIGQLCVGVSNVSAANQCNGRKVDGDPDRVICVCDKTNCGQLEFNWPQTKNQVILIQSSKRGKRFEVANLQLKPTNDVYSGGNSIRVNLNVEHQTILGWGGAFTDAAGYNLKNLSKPLADKLLQSYFGDNGLQYNFGRVPIGGSDFSPRAYTYDDSTEADYKLKNWTLANEDLQLKIPMIKEALELTRSSGRQLNLFASPWSPPAWMKENNNLVRGHLIDTDKNYRSYANYLVKFFDAYQQHNIEFWGATVQNEPYSSSLPIYFFNSLQLDSEQTIKFVSKYLGPALEASNRTKENFKLMVGDDNLGFINNQVPAIMASPEVRKYISGLAFHWYTSGSIAPYDSITSLYNTIRDNIQFMIMSEACTGSMPFEKKVDLGSWDRAQAYASDIIEDLNRETAAWVDWNLALDTQGGPNWAKNFVDSPIIVNAKLDEFYKQPMYYSLAHFSRLFKPGSVRVETITTTSSSNILTGRSNILSTAVHNKKTGHLIINILNKSANDETVDIKLEDSSRFIDGFKMLLIIPGSSIVSVVQKL